MVTARYHRRLFDSAAAQIAGQPRLADVRADEPLTTSQSTGVGSDAGAKSAALGHIRRVGEPWALF